MNNPVETERTDNAAEQALLGAMIMDTQAIPSAVEHLTPRDLFRPAHETIMALIIDEWEHGRPIDPRNPRRQARRHGHAETGRRRPVHSYTHSGHAR